MNKTQIEEVLIREFPWLSEVKVFGNRLSDVSYKLYNSMLDVEKEKQEREKEKRLALSTMIGYDSKSGLCCLVYTKRSFESLLQHRKEFPEIMSFGHAFASEYDGITDGICLDKTLEYLSMKADATIVPTGRKIKHNGTYDCSYTYEEGRHSQYIPAVFYYDEILELCPSTEEQGGD